MTLEVYLPAALEEQIDIFNSALGNHNVDYRTTTAGDIYILDIPYTSIDSGSSISVDCLPYSSNGEHVSGYNLFFKEFPIEILIRNNSEHQRHILITTNEDKIYGVSYSHTEVQSVNSSSSILKHYYIYTKDKITSLTGKQVIPAFYKSSLINAGVITKRDCGNLSFSDIKTDLSYRLLGNLLEISQPINSPIQTSLEYPIEDVGEDFVYLTCVIVKTIDEVYKTEVKTKLIGIAKEDDDYEMKGTRVLTDRVCNYNFYFTILNESYPTSEGYTIPLRPREIALLNSTIRSTQPHTNIGLLSETTFSFDEVYSRGLGRPFACFKLQIPRTGFKDIFGDNLPFRISTDNGVTWDVLGTYDSDTYDTEFKVDFVNYMREKGLLCYSLPEDVFIVQNTTDNDFEFILHYDLLTNMETIGEDITTEDGSVINFSSNNIPENFSICRTTLIDKENIPIDSRAKYLEKPESYSLHIAPFSINDIYPSIFKNTIRFSVNLQSLLSASSYSIVIDDIVTQVTLDLTTETEETVLDTLIESLTEELINFTATKEESSFIIKYTASRSLIKFNLECDGVSLASGQSLFKDGNKVLMRGL